MVIWRGIPCASAMEIAMAWHLRAFSCGPRWIKTLAHVAFVWILVI